MAFTFASVRMAKAPQLYVLERLCQTAAQR